jgi:hypothetical protein
MYLQEIVTLTTEAAWEVARSTTLKRTLGRQSLTWSQGDTTWPPQSSMTSYILLAAYKDCLVVRTVSNISTKGKMNGSFIREFRISSQVIQSLPKNTYKFVIYNYLTTKRSSLSLVYMSSVMLEDWYAPCANIMKHQWPAKYRIQIQQALLDYLKTGASFSRDPVYFKLW